MHIEGNDSGLEGSQIIFGCQTGLVPSHSVVSNCTNQGTWLPDPSQLRCKGTLVNARFIMNFYLHDS